MPDCQPLSSQLASFDGVRAAQIESARDELAGIDLSALPADARGAIGRALQILAAPADDRGMPTDVGVRAHEMALERLRGCWEAMDAENGSEDPADWTQSPACAPFCGCEDCTVREVLDAAWPVFEADVFVRLITQNGSSPG